MRPGSFRAGIGKNTYIDVPVSNERLSQLEMSIYDMRQQGKMPRIAGYTSEK